MTRQERACGGLPSTTATAAVRPGAPQAGLTGRGDQRGQGRSPTAPANPPGKVARLSPQLPSPPAAPLNLPRAPAARCLARGSGTSEKGAGRRGRSRPRPRAPELNPERTGSDRAQLLPQGQGTRGDPQASDSGQETAAAAPRRDSSGLQNPRRLPGPQGTPALGGALFVPARAGRRADSSAPARGSDSTGPTGHLRSPQPPHPGPLASAPRAAGRAASSAPARSCCSCVFTFFPRGRGKNPSPVRRASVRFYQFLPGGVPGRAGGWHC